MLQILECFVITQDWVVLQEITKNCSTVFETFATFWDSRLIASRRTAFSPQNSTEILNKLMALYGKRCV